MLDFLEGEDLLDQWKTIGGVPTLLSYGLPAKLLSSDPFLAATLSAAPKKIADFTLDDYRGKQVSFAGMQAAPKLT